MELREFKRFIFKYSLVALLSLLTVPSPLWASGGGASDGGGGGVVPFQDQYILTDFFNLSQLPSNLLENKAQSFESALANSLRIANKWAKLPLEMLGYRVVLALESNLRWEFTDTEIKTPPFFRSLYLPAKSEIIPAAYYQLRAGDSLVTLSRPLWQRMSLNNQSALLIHEAFRQVQIGYSLQFNDETLQKATAIFMSCKPSVKLSQYMNLLALNLMDEATERFGSFESLTENCREIQ